MSGLGSLSAYIKGEELPRVDILLKLAEIGGVTMDDLLKTDNPPQKKEISIKISTGDKSPVTGVTGDGDVFINTTVTKINVVLDFSADEIIQILNIPTNKEARVLWPAAVSEGHDHEYQISKTYPEKRLRENIPKRRLIDKVIKIWDSGNKKAIHALESNVGVCLEITKTKEVEIKGGD